LRTLDTLFSLEAKIQKRRKSVNLNPSSPTDSFVIGIPDFRFGAAPRPAPPPDLRASIIENTQAIIENVAYRHTNRHAFIVF